MSVHTHRMVNGESVPLTDAEIAELDARDAAWTPDKDDLNAPILGQIAALESKQSRAVREMLLNVTGASDRLKTIDTQIAALRAQLVK